MREIISREEMVGRWRHLREEGAPLNYNQDDLHSQDTNERLYNMNARLPTAVMNDRLPSAVMNRTTALYIIGGTVFFIYSDTFDGPSLIGNHSQA